MIDPFFFHATATAEIYTLSLHDALPIYFDSHVPDYLVCPVSGCNLKAIRLGDDLGLLSPVSKILYPVIDGDRKSTRLNSSHGYISYAVFCLKKKIVDPEDLRVNQPLLST